jgi:hypothetical protein
VTKLLPILNVLGLMLIVFSVTYAMPLVAALVFDDGTFRDFVEAGLMTLAAGALLWFGTRKFKRELKPRDGYLLVVLGWVFMAGIATLPLLLHIDSADGFGCAATGDQPVAARAQLAWRNGDHRAGRGNPATAGCWRHADVQGGNAGAVQGQQAHAADR